MILPKNITFTNKRKNYIIKGNLKLRLGVPVRLRDASCVNPLNLTLGNTSEGKLILYIELCLPFQVSFIILGFRR